MPFFLFFLFSNYPLQLADDVQENDPQVYWISLSEAQKQSSEDGKPIFVFVEAEWCGICKRMLREVFPTEKISTMLSDKFHVVSIDLDSKNETFFNGDSITERNFAKKMNVQQTPTTIFIDKNGDIMGNMPGFLNETELTTLLNYVLSDEFGDLSFEEFQGK